MPFFLRAILAPIVALISGTGVYFLLTDWSEEALTQAVRTGNRLADMFYATPALEGHVWPVVYALVLLALTIASVPSMVWVHRRRLRSQGTMSRHRIRLEFVGAIAFGVLASASNSVMGALTVANVVASALVLAPPIVVIWEIMRAIMFGGADAA